MGGKPVNDEEGLLALRTYVGKYNETQFTSDKIRENDRRLRNYISYKTIGITAIKNAIKNYVIELTDQEILKPEYRTPVVPDPPQFPETLDEKLPESNLSLFDDQVVNEPTTTVSSEDKVVIDVAETPQESPTSTSEKVIEKEGIAHEDILTTLKLLVNMNLKIFENLSIPTPQWTEPIISMSTDEAIVSIKEKLVELGVINPSADIRSKCVEMVKDYAKVRYPDLGEAESRQAAWGEVYTKFSTKYQLDFEKNRLSLMLKENEARIGTKKKQLDPSNKKEKGFQKLDIIEKVEKLPEFYYLIKEILEDFVAPKSNNNSAQAS